MPWERRSPSSPVYALPLRLPRAKVEGRGSRQRCLIQPSDPFLGERFQLSPRGKRDFIRARSLVGIWVCHRSFDLFVRYCRQRVRVSSVPVCRTVEAPSGGGGVGKKLSINTSAFASFVSATRFSVWSTGILYCGTPASRSSLLSRYSSGRQGKHVNGSSSGSPCRDRSDVSPAKTVLELHQAIPLCAVKL